MATLELFNPTTGESLGNQVTLRNGKIDWSKDPEHRIQAIIGRMALKESPEKAFSYYTGWSNGQVTVGLRLKEGK